MPRSGFFLCAPLPLPFSPLESVDKARFLLAVSVLTDGVMVVAAAVVVDVVVVVVLLLPPSVESSFYE